MATRKQIEDALIAVNHNTTAIRESLAKHSAEHTDILGEITKLYKELTLMNENWFNVLKSFFSFLKWFVGLTMTAIIGLKLGGLI